MLASLATALVFTSVISSPLRASGPDDVEIGRGSGGTVQTKLSDGIVVNDRSTLEREWVVVRHKSMPAAIKGLNGVRTAYESGRGYSGEYVYKAAFDILVTEPLAAIEVRFILFDVWGNRIKSLRLVEVSDFPTGTHTLDGKWNYISENEVSEYYASIGYVARVRTKAGKVLAANPEPVVDEARKLSAKFSADDLEPELPKVK